MNRITPLIGLLALIWISCLPLVQAQSQETVVVYPFTSEIKTDYNRAVTEKVIGELTASKRFQVIDYTGRENAKAEIEMQKGREFRNSDNLAEQGKLAAGTYLLNGHINYVDVQKIRNPLDNSINGYKASISFSLNVVETATGLNREAQTFYVEEKQRVLQPRAAVGKALQSLEAELQQYFYNNFIIRARVAKIANPEKKKKATILIDAGSNQGIRVGDVFEVQQIERIGDKELPTALGQIKVTKVVSGDFSECRIAGGLKTLPATDQLASLKCVLIP